ncbi:excinuclease ATPase subunit [Pokkaliibacter plantistimulans]|nr:excinuclease ATPase subunit [Pokkaliibacter plantistimulans]
MKLAHFITPLAMSALIVSSPIAMARDTKHMLPLASAMQSADFKTKLDPSIQLYFGNQKHGQVTKQLLEGVVTNKKTNAVGKTDEAACQWALLSALISLQDRAKKEGGNAIVNIHSYYKKNEVNSPSEFECHAGGIMAGVALKGDIVKLK